MMSCRCRKNLFCLVTFAVSWSGFLCSAEEQIPEPVHPGYRLLVEKAYTSPAVDEEIVDELWRSWPEPLRSRAEQASRSERRKLTFQRYGWGERPGQSELPLQYVVDEDGNWRSNCFTCHGGRVNGRVIPGAPNSQYAMQTLIEEILLTRNLIGSTPKPSELGGLFMPLGSTTGTTNAVMFGVVLMGIRDADLNVVSRKSQQLVHHDMDAPPWWNFSKRRQLYIDGFAQKSPRALMPFVLEPTNGPERFRDWESDFRQIYDFLESIEPPPYPFEIDEDLARTGQKVFRETCARCHGTYGANAHFPEVTVPIDEIGTDRVRFDALSTSYRSDYGASWFGYHGQSKVLEEPEGYVAPPLDGIWASAPYFHNGSVPTLWHLLHPDQRPAIWQRIDPDGYDSDRVGVVVKALDRVPNTLQDRAIRRQVFDTSVFGKGASGHLYPAELSEPERRAVLEFLKTL